jgi:hypothetical protein
LHSIMQGGWRQQPINAPRKILLMRMRAVRQ